MKQFIGGFMCIACGVLLGMMLVHLMFDMEPSVPGVFGSLCGATVGYLVVFWMQSRSARRSKDRA